MSLDKILLLESVPMSTTIVAASKSVFGSPQMRLAAGGWVFFVVENAVLSENRTWLIDYLGDDNYHLLYGTFSTAATASIGYAYYKITRGGGGVITGIKLSILSRLGSWGFLSAGVILASQALPKMQIPFMVSSSSSSSESSSNGLKFQVRCPFDFADQKHASDAALRGMERVTRHPGLWSLALMGAGNAVLHTHPPLKMWWYGPTLVAWLGGAHSDSRFRRGMGGTLDPGYDSQTSNFPFAAMLCGKQGTPSRAFTGLIEETKLLNAGCAVAMASLWILSRGRVR